MSIESINQKFSSGNSDEIKKTRFSEIDAATTEGKSTVRIIRDAYWWCREGDHRRALVYKKYNPQCNHIRSIALSFKSIKRLFPDAELIKIPLAFCPLDTDQ